MIARPESACAIIIIGEAELLPKELRLDSLRINSNLVAVQSADAYLPG
jgi:hypothetical protein